MLRLDLFLPRIFTEKFSVTGYKLRNGRNRYITNELVHRCSSTRKNFPNKVVFQKDEQFNIGGMHKLPHTLNLGCFASNRNPCESNVLVREAKRLKTKEGSINFALKVFRGRKENQILHVGTSIVRKSHVTYKSRRVTSATKFGG